MNKSRKQDYNMAYMRMAYEFSKLSHAERSKVGCIIVSENDQIISQGYNGMPRGMHNCCEHIDEDGNLHTNCEVLHAETNALMKCARDGGRTQNSRMYITLSPCYDCAKVIIQAGIKKVYYAEKYRDLRGIELLEECGIEVEYLPINTYKEDGVWYAVNEFNKPILIVGENSYELKENTIMNSTSFDDRTHEDKPIKITI